MVMNGVIQLVNSELFLNKVLIVDVLCRYLVRYLQDLGKVHFCWSFTLACLLRDMCILDHQKVLKIFFDFLTSSWCKLPCDNCRKWNNNVRNSLAASWWSIYSKNCIATVIEFIVPLWHRLKAVVFALSTAQWFSETVCSGVFVLYYCFCYIIVLFTCLLVFIANVYVFNW